MSFGEERKLGGLAPPVAVPQRISLAHSALLLEYILALGNLDLARDLTDRILHMPRAMRSECLPALLEGLPVLQDWESLEPLLSEARQRADGMAVLGPLADRADGRRAAVRGDPRAAAALLRSALAGFENLHIPFEAARTREALALVLPDEADSLRAAAAEGYRALGAAPHLERLAAEASTPFAGDVPANGGR